MKEQRTYKIITWGLRYSDFSRQRDLFALKRNGDVEIIAEAAYEASDEEIFFCRTGIEESLGRAYDHIILCGIPKGDAVKQIKSAGCTVDENKIVSLEEFIAPYHEASLHRQVEILETIVSATDEEIRDRAWMRAQLRDYGYFPFFKLTKKAEIDAHFTSRGIQQVPEEFLDYCMELGKLTCENAIEIGVAAGGSSYVMAALLYRNNPDMTYHMVDIADLLAHFEEAKRIIPSLRKEIPHTSEDFKGQVFDYCFIDADHSYAGVMADWENVGKYTKKLLTFHDIYAHEYDYQDGGCVRGWQEIKELCSDKKVREYSYFNENWMGIGTVDMR